MERPKPLTARQTVGPSTPRLLGRATAVHFAACTVEAASCSPKAFQPSKNPTSMAQHQCTHILCHVAAPADLFRSKTMLRKKHLLRQIDSRLVEIPSDDQESRARLGLSENCLQLLMLDVVGSFGCDYFRLSNCLSSGTTCYGNP